MKRVLSYAVPLALLAAFGLILDLGSGPGPIGWSAAELPRLLADVRGKVLTGDWPAADDRTDDALAAWSGIIRRIQFSVERDDIINLSLALSRLKAAIAAEDRSLAIREISEAEFYWSNLGR